MTTAISFIELFALCCMVGCLAYSAVIAVYNRPMRTTLLRTFAVLIVLESIWGIGVGLSLRADVGADIRAPYLFDIYEPYFLLTWYVNGTICIMGLLVAHMRSLVRTVSDTTPNDTNPVGLSAVYIGAGACSVSIVPLWVAAVIATTMASPQAFLDHAITVVIPLLNANVPLSQLLFFSAAGLGVIVASIGMLTPRRIREMQQTQQQT